MKKYSVKCKNVPFTIPPQWRGKNVQEVINAKSRIIITDENSVSRYIIFINVLKDVEQKNHCIYKLVILKHAVLFINQINFDLNIKS